MVTAAVCAAVLVLFASASALVPVAPPLSIAMEGSIPSNMIKIGALIGSGTFGTAHWARLLPQPGGGTGQPQIIVAKSAAVDNKRASEYLDTEDYLNRRLCFEGEDRSPQIAPFLGDCSVNGTRHLLWEESGAWTLQDVIARKEQGLRFLASALGVPPPSAASPHALAREVLRQVLEGLAFCHSKGIVHRDVKPANVLVDGRGRRLRLIDFGSACDIGAWLFRKGYRGGGGGGVRTVLYCAPEEFVEEGHPYAFDVYSAAVTWLRLLVPALRESEEALFGFRVAVRDCHHDLAAWQEQAALAGGLPGGWEGLFGCAEGREAWRLLVEMMRYEAAGRPTACDALLGSYLNPSCTASPRAEPPPMPWSLKAQLEAWGAAPAMDNCRLDDEAFDEVYTVELPVRTGVDVAARGGGGGGVVVGGLLAGGAGEAEGVGVGDQLLSVGPIDVEDAEVEYVSRLLGRWPKGTVRLQLGRGWRR